MYKMIKFKYMKLHKSILLVCIISFCSLNSFSQTLGIEHLNEYVPIIKNKRVGLVVNHTSQINNTHLIDTLLVLGVNINAIFSPEHGFLGDLDAGEYFDNSMYNDSIPIISLYKNKNIKDINFDNLDVVVFDIQDVGVRFYTYISTLHYVMQGCAVNNIQLIVLDRPNPHAHYIDGPVLSLDYSSFVGMHPVPIVYGMTIGEYALMINGEGWLNNQLYCDLYIVKNRNYGRYDIVPMAVYPSPNLRSMNAIFLYPSLCLFEGTQISVGRGTNNPFETYGAPFFNTKFSFKPISSFGAKYPKFENKICYGFDLKDSFSPFDFMEVRSINIKYLIHAYQNTPDQYKTSFFNDFFKKLAGNSQLQKDIVDGLTELEIRESWQLGLKNFTLIRNKYLLYD